MARDTIGKNTELMNGVCNSTCQIAHSTPIGLPRDPTWAFLISLAQNINKHAYFSKLNDEQKDKIRAAVVNAVKAGNIADLSQPDQDTKCRGIFEQIMKIVNHDLYHDLEKCKKQATSDKDIIERNENVIEMQSDINVKIISVLEKITGKDGNSQKTINAIYQAIESSKKNSNIELGQQLEDALGHANELSDMAAVALDDLKTKSSIDPLTGLYTRGMFDEHMIDLIEKFQKSPKTIHPTLLFFDIDHFKVFNDKYGHQVGDQVLSFVASDIQSSVPKTEFVARYGGEEIVVVLNTVLSGKIAMDIANRIRQHVAGRDFRLKGQNKQINIYVSCGVGICTPDFAELSTDDAVARLIAIADNGVYTAKKAGRNCVKMGMATH